MYAITNLSVFQRPLTDSASPPTKPGDWCRARLWRCQDAGWDACAIVATTRRRRCSRCRTLMVR